MKKSTFSPAKIAGVLKEFAVVAVPMNWQGKTASVQRLCISGARNIMAWKPVNSSG